MVVALADLPRADRTVDLPLLVRAGLAHLRLQFKAVQFPHQIGHGKYGPRSEQEAAEVGIYGDQDTVIDADAFENAAALS
jgi:hypothetical protein